MKSAAVANEEQRINLSAAGAPAISGGDDDVHLIIPAAQGHNFNCRAVRAIALIGVVTRESHKPHLYRETSSHLLDASIKCLCALKSLN